MIFFYVTDIEMTMVFMFQRVGYLFYCTSSLLILRSPLFLLAGFHGLYVSLG